MHKDPEKRKAYVASYQKAHAVEIKAWKAAHYFANKEVLQAKTKDYRERNKEKLAAKAAEYRAKNKPLLNARGRAYRKSNRWKESVRHLRDHYGITVDEYEAMFDAQGGLCAICELPETSTRSGRLLPLHVDHDHATGKIRGLLCANCNALLGHAFEEQAIIFSAADYLAKHGAASKVEEKWRLIEKRCGSSSEVPREPTLFDTPAVVGCGWDG